ncbi:MAG TPA: CHASE2 domain-containing protein [Oscillatoriaceae cyanobacterium M33_DOE_052]|uniref:CHASE2 domain-containing protein n=1 Tax=Planktothricoides sp. SpSt-374 TaxID=2282167 RepID=A0A7C3VNV7_9CYAN|nr:CHASE2 domain-containing protein [Oscillatoriaceae cyanobacterium M33_DOE_052]
MGRFTQILRYGRRAGVNQLRQGGEWRWLLFASSGVSGLVLLLRLAGLLQSWEWGTYDLLFRWRPPEMPEQRILIVGIDDDDIGHIKSWPMSDRLLAELLQKLQASEPVAIGLDISRNLPMPPGTEELDAVLKSIPNLIGIQTLADQSNIGITPLPVLAAAEQIGFNNVMIDADGKVRRNLLYWRTSHDNQLHKSLAQRLAWIYLNAKGLPPQPVPNNPSYLQLGRTVLRPFEASDGGYVRADSLGYQFLANFRPSKDIFDTVTLRDVLADRVAPERIRDRIVLIGANARSIKDFFETPYSAGLVSAPDEIAGVELHANFVSQILCAAIDGRHPSIRVWSDPIEWLWIFLWSAVGAHLCWRCGTPSRSFIAIIISQGVIGAICYIAFLFCWWLPLVPSALSLLGSAITVTSYIAHLQDELKKSKEFLNQIIDTIPDPIFVKDQHHRWVVLNNAYANFIGYPISSLINHSEFDFLPGREAAIFRDKDNLVFATGQSSENEEEFTDARGITHFIATKRSLHRDPAGNLFLVGVIRDITERKQMEDALKQTAADLARSNEELKLSEDGLRYIAYHDTLTGLPNRKLFYERLDQALEWAAINNQSVALMFLDLDGFKLINDTCGHDTGDLLLQAVADRLTRSLRGSDTVSRLGGDEFTVILPAISEPIKVERVAQKIITTLSHSFAIGGAEISVTASIGISLYPGNGEDADTLIKNADAAMYRAKELGKNQYAFSQTKP